MSGAFELTDPSGLPAGHIEVTLKWKFTYIPPSGSIMTVELPKLIPKETLADEPTPEQHSEEDKALTDKDLEEILEVEKKAKDHPPHSASLSFKVRR